MGDDGESHDSDIYAGVDAADYWYGSDEEHAEGHMMRHMGNHRIMRVNISMQLMAMHTQCMVILI